MKNYTNPLDANSIVNKEVEHVSHTSHTCINDTRSKPTQKKMIIGIDKGSKDGDCIVKGYKDKKGKLHITDVIHSKPTQKIECDCEEKTQTTSSLNSKTDEINKQVLKDEEITQTVVKRTNSKEDVTVEERLKKE